MREHHYLAADSPCALFEDRRENGMSYVIGEDRSSFQAVSPWGPDAFGFCKATEGTSWSDPTFSDNWATLGREGKIRGAYHFFHPAENPVTQAQFFVTTVRAHGFGPGDIFIADVEIVAGADGSEDYGTARAAARAHEGLKSAAYSLGSASTGDLAREFLAEVERQVGPQCPVLLYTDLFMAQNILGACISYPLFVAYYEPSPPRVTPWASWAFWQNGGTGAGGGDADYFNGDEAELLAWHGSYATGWTEALVNNLPTLQLGSKDSAGATFYVRRLQNDVAGYGRWNSLGKVTAIADDGNFGPSTKLAVEAVQGHAGIGKDGIAGKDTWTVLIG
jgi:Glycosyl hydrolases family 25/Putative peptidoglycan binding domain